MKNLWRNSKLLRTLAKLMMVIIGTISSCAGFRQPPDNGDNSENPPDTEIQIVRESGTTIIRRTVPLSSEALIAIDQAARGITEEGMEECIFLKIEGIQAEENMNVLFAIYVGDPAADASYGIQTPNYVTSFSLSPFTTGNKPSNFYFSLDKNIRNLGKTIFRELEQKVMSVCLVAVPTEEGQSLDEMRVKVDVIDIYETCE